MSHLSRLDYVCLAIDQGLRTVFKLPCANKRVNPAADIVNPSLEEEEARKAAALMRVNHAGEVCAQALYLGQAITSHGESMRNVLHQSAQEEIDHLAWCQQRLQELNSHTSYLNPLWYMGSLGIGMMAGLAGDKWNLGFLAETEQQVSAHLERHLQKLPVADEKSRAIVKQMQEDEQQHANTAVNLGAHALPKPVQMAMRLASKVMTSVAHRV